MSLTVEMQANLSLDSGLQSLKVIVNASRRLSLQSRSTLRISFGRKGKSASKVFS
jgi:hypothetical protein